MTLSYVASSLAPLELAAHQLVYSLWSLCSYATVPLEQVALAFVPAARGARRYHRLHRNARATRWQLPAADAQICFC